MAKLNGYVSACKIFYLETIGVKKPVMVDCEEVKVTTVPNPILLIRGLDYMVGVTGTGRMYIGCKDHTVDEWRNFSEVEINRMDYRALDFWKTWSSFLLEVCAKYKHEQEI